MKNLACFIAFATLAACAGAEENVGDESNEVVVDEGKEDNFLSVSASEYWVSGTGTFTLEPEYATKSAAEKLARAKKLVSLKNIQYSWFLNAYLIKKEDDAGNKNYGGFGAIARFGSEKIADPVVKTGLTYTFPFAVQVGGAKNLLTVIPGSTVSGGKNFELAVGKVSNSDLARLETNHEWYRDSAWGSFDPSTLAADAYEKATMNIKPQKAATDAWLAYDRLFQDGELTIALHTGWDYHSRYDITSARNVYNWLTQNGFKSPVTSFNLYLRTSGPLTKAIKSNGKTINVKVWVFHPGDASQGVPGADPDTGAGGIELENDMKESFKSREVIMYLGHSGPMYGFALANWRKTEEGDLDDSDVPGLVMPRTYQIVLANGCDTYAMGQAFWQNPSKSDGKNLNVITSTSFSNAGTEKSAIRLIQALTNQTSSKVIPVKLTELAKGLDQDQGYYFDTMFGIHGADNNPRYHPMSDATKLCKPCTADSACGADGNRCTKISTSARVCTFECTDTTGCPANYTCKAIATGNTIQNRQCVPTTLKCR